MNRQKALNLIKELAYRHQNRPQFLTQGFESQNNFIIDPSPLKAVQCSRRAGKSYGAGSYLFKEAYESPGVSLLYITLTRDLAKRIMFKDVLSKINRDKNIGATANLSELSFTLPNGSIIYLSGADATPDEMNKLLGQKYKLVVIDEAAFFKQDMEKMVYEILKPAVADYNGTIALISTTSSYTNSLYYKITMGLEKGWKTFKWTAEDNPFMKTQWAKEIAFLKENKPGIEETPMFRRMYLNEWHIDEQGLIYKFNPKRNSVDTLPDEDWNYILGIDLGYNDATAMVVCAYSHHDPNLYVVETFSKTQMIISDVADKIRELNKKYQFVTMVVDGAAKQAVEEIRKRHQIPLVIAEKQGKREYIELLNSDLITSNIKLLPNTAPLSDEWKVLIWDEQKLKKGKYVEHPGQPNHLSDAFLYAWRWSYNYAHMPKVKIPKRGTEEEVDQFWEDQADFVSRKKSNPQQDWYK